MYGVWLLGKGTERDIGYVHMLLGKSIERDIWNVHMLLGKGAIKTGSLVIANINYFSVVKIGLGHEVK